MKNSLIQVITVTLIITVSVVAMPESDVFKIVQLTDQIFQLSTDEENYTTNHLVFVGKDGILLVDTNAGVYAEEFKKVIEAFGKGLPKYIINTHRHVEHIGGNAIFGDSPIKIAHYLVPEKLKSGSFIFNEFPDETYPDITLTDSLFLYFNGEKIRIIANGGSHDDNELLIHFTNSKVVHLSSVINGMNFPSIDGDGDINGFAPLVKRAIKLLPEDVVIVSGHNNNSSWQDLHKYYDMMVNSMKIVKDGLAAGKDVETMQKEKVLADYEAFNQSYVSTDQWINTLATFEESQKNSKKKIYVPLYYALKDSGIDGAVDLYNKMKTEQADEYDLNEVALMVIGNKLKGKNKFDEAMVFFDLSLKEFPEGMYNYYIYYLMASIYKDQNNKEMALECCNKSIELNSEFQAATTLLEELKTM
jgi:glyoxylase-like metal-dependent hydrolase (beta-lactamase superfamily II)